MDSLKKQSQIFVTGLKSLVIDKRDHIGGNCYDYIDKHGIRVNTLTFWLTLENLKQIKMIPRSNHGRFGVSLQIDRFNLIEKNLLIVNSEQFDSE